ncbi:HAD-IC family P-type ATPase [Enterococcus sp. LJL120]
MAKIPDVLPAEITGLTLAEISQAQKSGHVNQSASTTLKSTKDILRENIFTLFNLLNVVLAALVVWVGSPQNALFLMVMIINSGIGIFQELRSKKTIDSLAILAKVPVVAVRNAQFTSLSEEEILLGDTLFLQAGDQIPADGIVISQPAFLVDESLLTGESNKITKSRGDQLLSGSFVTAGEVYYQVTAVGADNYATKLLNDARFKKRPQSELLLMLRKLTRVLTLVIIPFGILMIYQQLQNVESFQQAILGSVAAVVSIIPEGLVLLTGVAFAVGAANLAKQKVLVQSLPSIETLARVNTLCLDKTGTITDGTLTVEKIVPLQDLSEIQLGQKIATLLASSADQNATAQALREKFPADQPVVPEEVIPFSSDYKWSGAKFTTGFLAMGAAEYIFAEVPVEVAKQSQAFMAEGYRVLVIVLAAQMSANYRLVEPQALGLIVLGDSLRENATAIFQLLIKQGVSLKIISGDHPLTVSKIAEKAGIPETSHFVDMSNIPDDTDFAQLVENNTVFGRVSPYQKQKLLQGLKQNHQVTGMVGDGVNDILALREADIGIAMAQGSQAARAVADVVLLTGDFSVMESIIKEGRRVINNLQRVSSMYLVKTIYAILLALIFILLATAYPFAPLQLTPINALTVGIPSFFLALQPSYERPRGNVLDNVLRISVPAALNVVISVLGIKFIGDIWQLDSAVTSTLSVFLVGVVGLKVLLRVSLPLNSKKIWLLLAMTASLIFCFLFLGKIFMYDNVFDADLLILIPFILFIHFFFDWTSRLMNQVIYWKNLRKKE